MNMVARINAMTTRSTCVVCGLSLPRALADHAVCVPCATQPDAARLLLENRERRILRSLALAQEAANAIWDTMPADEQARWDTIVQARIASAKGDATAAAKLATMQRLIAAHNSRLHPTLIAFWQADEKLFWANAQAADAGRRGYVALAQLEECLRAMEEAR